MSAIQDFATQLRTNRARTPVPPPVDPEVFRRALETLDISALFTPPTSVPASLAVPPPELAMHIQPEPEVEPEVDPVVEPEVEHIMEPTASVESHHPSADVHGVVGESIVVVERYVAPHQDEGTSGVIGTRRPTREPNVMWVLIEDPSASYGRRDLEFHVATVATRPIHAEEELLCHYLWGSGPLCTPCVFAPRPR
ncbi:hypothetical protein R1sor_026493 [Riccia sorocarpa]|uniref:Uncharacterized protein n=1 Tax=Riccia sorocarpa TaxID=122646 RepID=A0ABD3GBK7_9MARC